MLNFGNWLLAIVIILMLVLLWRRYQKHEREEREREQMRKNAREQQMLHELYFPKTKHDRPSPPAKRIVVNPRQPKR